MLFALVMLNNLGALAFIILLLAMGARSTALFATSPIIQTSLAKSADSAAALDFALNGSMLYFSQGLGAALGGWVTAQFGLVWVGGWRRFRLGSAVDDNRPWAASGLAGPGSRIA